MSLPGSALVSPPWRLAGRGFVLAYTFPPEFVEAQGLPAGLLGRFRGGPGAVMVVDYASSPVGPYRELLFLPGRFAVAGGLYPAITRIFVSSQASADNGRAHWALPKERATFESEATGRRRERVRVLAGGRVFFEAELAWSRWPLPVLVPRWPLPFTLAQPGPDGLRLTTLRGAALARRARLLSVRVTGPEFPDVCGFAPRFGVRTAPFRLVFPEARLFP
jgi:hypothetical protein